ncbi:hypothetical protein BK816_08130 [Boudabousia tangfeifanii]|uniref:Uncharacterized protein n=1 Tax=Boudabousia tangfeifanii TaxID=1912795 RepID=A0A1D9MLU8_9ACTO|nr:alpha/beta hydrolase [Boudabousia tangfeifanii]AOZ73255.1 hypothetical protein BK816_08130 [Boudabousia tangfeifanii]
MTFAVSPAEERSQSTTKVGARPAARKPLRRRLTTLGAVLAVSATLAACSFGSDGSDAVQKTVEPTPSASPIPAGLESYYDQKLVWGNCDSSIEATKESTCATFKVPKNYANPSEGDLSITAVKYVKSGVKPSGDIYTNPGGPGGSAVDFVAENASHVFTQEILDKFAIVGMDNRGTRHSTPIECITPQEMDALLSENTQDVLTEAGLAHERQRMADMGKKCLEKSDTIKWVDTVSAARDLDVLRHLNGNNKLDYLGFSYGTFFGATYAELFPKNVGHMVLDGALDPSLNYDQVAEAQMVGFEKSLVHFADECNDGNPNCFLGRGEDGAKQIMAFVRALHQKPLRTGDPKRPLTENLAITAIMGSMYNQQWFPILTQGLENAMLKGNGQILLSMADQMNDRLDDGTYKGNSKESFFAVNALDYPIEGDMDTWQKQAKELLEKHPILGEQFMLGDALRQDWPVKPVGKRGPIKAEGAPPILVIGTTGDPATPLSMAQSLAEQLDKGVLLTVKGWNHTAYNSNANECVTQTVDDIFLKDQMPKQNKYC